MSKITKNTEVSQLLDGYKNFLKEYYNGESDLLENLTLHGQQPKFCVICCSDSRADPAILFNTKPGDIFVQRQVGSIVPPYENSEVAASTSTALNFAVDVLKVKHIIVLGHTHCGGIEKLLLDYDCNCGWMNVLEDIRKEVMSKYSHLERHEQLRKCEVNALIQSYDNLFSFPCINERVNQQELSVHAWQFDLSSGDLLMYNVEEERFEVIP